jgi:deoxyadenosine/deoxycytidine kinase
MKNTNIHIEGNIGAGKSTLLEFIKDNLECNVSQEPVGDWMKMGLLDKFYKNIDRWSFAFQMNCFISRAQQVDKLPEGINFIERSILSDNIFATNCYENGNMDKLEYEIYRKWSKWLYNKVCKEVKNVIYLRSTPEVSYERIKKRNRDSEDEIPLEYLRALHKLHDDWLIDNENINVVVIDADKLILDDNIIELLKLSFFDTR